MCGIAGIVDLKGQATAPGGALARMASAIVHRGPDEDGYYETPGLAMASRRLSIVGLADGRQPISNEDGSVWVVFNGELFDYPERRAELEGLGHKFRTHTDTELFPHLWEQYGEGMFEKLRGQFAFALVDTRQRLLILGRDRFGICPLFTTTVTRDGVEMLLFASEVKALIASGLYEPAAEPHGLGHTLTFFGNPGPVTPFRGVRQLLPGRYLKVPLGTGSVPPLLPKVYWEMDFPEEGTATSERPPEKVLDRFEEVLLGAVQRRLRADVPVVSYLSGGVDSSIVVAMASKALGRPIPTFTIAIDDPTLNEQNEALVAARHVGCDPVIVPFRHADVLDEYPALTRAAEVPVIDTACAALLRLARRVRDDGYKVALTGEGSDEWLGGYPWFKGHKALNWLNVFGLPVSRLVTRSMAALQGIPRLPLATVRRSELATGGPHGWNVPYGLMSTAKMRFLSPEFRAALAGQHDYEDLELPTEKMRGWSNLSRGLYVAGRVQLQGLLLSSKGDRVAMNSSVETRYPFLDEEVFGFLAGLPDRWKLRGLTDKYVLRRLASRWLPKSIAWRRKVMFRAPLDSFHLEGAPPFVGQLLSDESLRKTGYFDAAAVRHHRSTYTHKRPGSLSRQATELGLVGVVATQLWHHTFLGGSLCEL